MTKLNTSSNLDLQLSSGDSLDVRQFSVHERLSSLFQINLIAMSENPSIDFDAVVGQPARFTVRAGVSDRIWTGLCNHIEQVRVAADGLSTYQVSLVPTLWLLTQRKNHRMFQQISEPDIALKILGEWNIEPDVRINKSAYKKRKYRVQYAESDFAFVSRMLEDAGIAYFFELDGDETKLVLSDAPQSSPARATPLVFMDDVSQVQTIAMKFVTSVRVGQRVRPGKVTLRDHDYRRAPDYKLMTTASDGKGIEEKLERFHYVPGAFLFGTDQGESTPTADDKGKARTDEKEGAALAQKRLDAKRGDARVCTFETNAYDLAPGVVFSIAGHPHAAVGDGKTLLVVESSLSGTDRGEWSQHCEARGTNIPFRPPLVTPKPKVNGVESATVVGPAGEEIHTDEFGRVRVHFHWDRESKMDDNSSCWIHVSQPWGGSGYGGSNLPRIGQEVLVDFLSGDPDRPVIVGRVYTNLQKKPYKLPDNKTQSGWKSNSTGGGGGYNEIMFEDAQGKELVRMQAEKDLKKLVKHNENVTIGNNRIKFVGANDTLMVAKNQKISIGLNRSTSVGVIDSTTVGDTHLVMVTPPSEGGGGGGNTTIMMQNQSIVLDTGGGAKIMMQGSNIDLTADTISLTADIISLWANSAVKITPPPIISASPSSESGESAACGADASACGADSSAEGAAACGAQAGACGAEASATGAEACGAQAGACGAAASATGAEACGAAAGACGAEASATGAAACGAEGGACGAAASASGVEGCGAAAGACGGAAGGCGAAGCGAEAQACGAQAAACGAAACVAAVNACALHGDACGAHVEGICSEASLCAVHACIAFPPIS